MDSGDICGVNGAEGRGNGRFRRGWGFLLCDRPRVGLGVAGARAVRDRGSRRVDRIPYRAAETRYSVCINPGEMSAITPRLGICIGWARRTCGSVAGPLLDRIIRDRGSPDTNFARAVTSRSTTRPASPPAPRGPVNRPSELRDRRVTGASLATVPVGAGTPGDRGERPLSTVKSCPCRHTGN
jgi:hypothetical protein